MKNFFFACVVAMGTSACVIESGGSEEGYIEVPYTLVFEGTDGDCADFGASKIEVLSTLEGTALGVSDIFDCTSGGASVVTAPLPTGNYTVVVNLLDANNGALGYMSPPLSVTVLDGLTAVTPEVIFAEGDNGVFAMTWSADCASFGATKFEILSTLSGTADGFADQFDCSAGSGVTAPLPPGTYEVVFNLLDQTDASVAMAGPETHDIQAGYATDLGDIIFL